MVELHSQMSSHANVECGELMVFYLKIGHLRFVQSMRFIQECVLANTLLFSGKPHNCLKKYRPLCYKTSLTFHKIETANGK